MEDLYPSRLKEKRIIERKDPVVYTNDASGPLSADQLASYEENGFLFFESFFDADEVQSFVEEIERIRRESHGSTEPEVITEPESEDVRSVFAVHEGSPVFKALSKDPKLSAAIEQILGSELYIHQSRINFKPGFTGKEFWWHSDFETWHAEDGMPRMRALSCSIALTDNTPFNGPLMLIPGSHRYFISTIGQAPENHYEHSLKKQEYGVPDHESLAWMAAKHGIVAPTGKTGSMLLFECNTMHGSNSNISPMPRSNVFLVFNSVENHLVEPFAGTKARPEYIASRQSATPVAAGA